MGTRRLGLALPLLLAALIAGCGDEEEPSEFVDIGAGLKSMHMSALAWGDYDGDGDLDLALTGSDGVFPSITRHGFLYRNDGGTFVGLTAILPQLNAGSLAWGDYDGDGDLDLGITGTDGTDKWSLVYVNDGGALTDSGTVLPGFTVSCIAWADRDLDGDLDFALMGWEIGDTSHRVGDNNAGTLTVAYSSAVVWSGQLVWGDFDNDGDADYITTGTIDDVAGYTGETRLYTNTGAGGFTSAALPAVAAYQSGLAAGDYDSDGDLDLAVSGIMNDAQRSVILRNDGGSFADIGADLIGAEWPALAWGDYDNDGDLDLALAGESAGYYRTRIYRNEGAGSFVDSGIGIRGVGRCDIAWADYDSDGDLDLAVSGGYCSAIYRNDVALANTPPAAPTGLAVTVSGATEPYEVLFKWDRSVDVETPQSGLTYNLRVWTDDGSTVTDVKPAHADRATGCLSTPEIGNTWHAGPTAAAKRSWTLQLSIGDYFWAVQAVDAAFEGGAWTTGQPFAVP